jgi:Domain of unknown function (DUF4124)/WXXGXW repeat (2 copies)
MRANPRRHTVLLIAMVSVACPGWVLRAGEIYKSVDAQGHVVYSDRPDASLAQQSAVEVDGGDGIADVGASVTTAPPPLQDEQQPPPSDDADIWTPGYWAWDAAGYYWVPGEWIAPPQVGYLWTPGYWVFVDSRYVFRRGYWGRHVGYYGGVNYGYGYSGTGYAASNVGVRGLGRVSYSGGVGGTTAVMSARERAFAAEPHMPPTYQQRQLLVRAARTPELMPQKPDRVSVAPTQKTLLVRPPGSATVARPSASQPANSQREVPRPFPTSTRVVPHPVVTRAAAPIATTHRSTPARAAPAVHSSLR